VLRGQQAVAAAAAAVVAVAAVVAAVVCNAMWKSFFAAVSVETAVVAA
jgi:hypothetical protein